MGQFFKQKNGGGDAEEDDDAADAMERFDEMRARFRMCTRTAIVNFLKPPWERQKNRPSPTRHKGSTMKGEARRRASVRAKDDGTLRSQFRTIWDRHTSPSWGKRTTESWGGVGYHCLHHESSNSHSVRLQAGWETQVQQVAAAFDERHTRFSVEAKAIQKDKSVLTSDDPFSTERVDQCLFGLRSNRYTVQPLRLDTSAISPRRDSSLFEAKEEYNKPLALTVTITAGLLCPYTRSSLTAVRSRRR